MNVAKELLRKNLIQIDKTNPDFSELKNILNILNSEQHVTLFVAYKQDLEEGFSDINFIRIDLNPPFNKTKYTYVASSAKPKKMEKFYFKLYVLNFVKKYL